MYDDKESMIPVYVKLIRAGRRDLDSVPEELREAVREAVNANEELPK